MNIVTTKQMAPQAAQILAKIFLNVCTIDGLQNSDDHGFQSTGSSPFMTRYSFAFEKCLHPKNAPPANGEG